MLALARPRHVEYFDRVRGHKTGRLRSGPFRFDQATIDIQYRLVEALAEPHSLACTAAYSAEVDDESSIGIEHVLARPLAIASTGKLDHRISSGDRAVLRRATVWTPAATWKP